MAPSRGIKHLLWQPCKASIFPRCLHCSFTQTTIRSSGHNRWSKIKHDKARVDSARHKAYSQFSIDLAAASKSYGPDPSLNPKLADLITKAKREGFSKSGIEAAIARGQGRSLNGAKLENITVEGILPGNVGVVVECETDGKARTLSDVRLMLKEAGGSAAPSVYLFQKKGRVVFEPKDGVGAEEALDAALEAGATDVDEDGDGRLVLSTEPGDTRQVAEAMERVVGLSVASEEIVWEANDETKVGVRDETAALELSNFIDTLLEKEATVQAVAMNVAQGSLDEGAWSELQSRLGG